MENSASMKYRVTVCPSRHSGEGIHEDSSMIYLDTDFKLTKAYGIFDNEGRAGSLFRDKPKPEWIAKVLKVPGVLSVHLHQYQLLIMYAPLFDAQKVVAPVARIVKATFAKGQQLQRLPDYQPPGPAPLLPEDLERKLRRIIEDHFYRSRRWLLRKKSKEQ